EPHYFLGRIAASRNQTEQALDHYQKALAMSPRYWAARLSLAELFLKKGKLSDSREEVRKVLEIQANNLGARLLKATIDTIEKKYPEAEKELTTLLRESPNTALIHRQMGVYYQSRGLPKDAEKSLIRALELDPDSEDILSTLTQFYITQKQTD